MGLLIHRGTHLVINIVHTSMADRQVITPNGDSLAPTAQASTGPSA